MNSTDLIKYTEKIYAWSIKRTSNRYEAEELSLFFYLLEFWYTK